MNASSFIVGLAVFLIIGIMTTFYVQAASQNIKNNVAGINTNITINSTYNVLANTFSVAPTSYCDVPKVLAQGHSPEIDGRNIVYVTMLNNSLLPRISVYGLGNDSIAGNNDDLGIIYPFNPLSNWAEYDPKIWGDTIVFLRFELNTLARSVIVYSLGNDSIAGTSDDIGPFTAYAAPGGINEIRKLSIDNNVVVFELYNAIRNTTIQYMCTTEYVVGSCWRGNAQQINTLRNVTKENIFGTGYSNQWTFLWDENNNNERDVYFYDGNIEGVFYNDTDYEQIEDVSGNFLVYSQKSSRLSSNSKIGFGFIGAPFVKNNISRTSAYSDVNPKIAHNSGKNGEFFVSWIRRNGNNFRYMVSSLNSGVDITVPYSYTYYRVPKIDKNTLVFDSNGSIYGTSCYYKP